MAANLRELCIKAACGDSNAVAEFITLIEPVVRCSIARIYPRGDPNFDDAQQEAFLKLLAPNGKIFSILAAMSDDKAICRFLYVTYRHLAIDLRRKKLKPTGSDFDTKEHGLAQNLATYIPTADQIMEREERLSLLNQSIAKLTEKYQLVVKLRLAEKSSEEIAAALHCTVRTVNTRYLRAKKMLKKLMERWL